MTIKEMREKLGLSQTKFAQFYGIPKRTIENWESGTRKPPEYVIGLLEAAVKRRNEMTKEKAKTIAGTYKMEILRNPVTGEAWGVWCDTEQLIPELDDLTEISDQYWACTRERIGENEYRYKLVLPTSWFDLWGWK